MTDDELIEEIARKKEALLLKKRRLEESSQISQKRLKLMKELEDLEVEESNLPTSSSSEDYSSASSSSSNAPRSSVSNANRCISLSYTDSRTPR